MTGNTVFGNVASEMKDVVKHIGIIVPLPVEVLQRKPVGIEYCFRFRTFQGFEQTTFKFIVRHSEILAAAYVVEIVPETLWD